MAELNWKHHTLIQALMSRGPLNEVEFRRIFAGVLGNDQDANDQNFNNFLLRINKKLSYVQMELRCCRNQNDSQVFYGLVNTVSDEQSKLGTKYSVPQITFFKGIIEAIMQDDTAKGSISSIEALNIRLESQVQNVSGSETQGSQSQVPPAFRNFLMSQKETTLHELVRDKWLCNTSDGQIGLGVRSYLDLRSWFHSSGVPSCEVCNEAAIKAEVCQSESCTRRIHLHCLKKKFSQSRSRTVCSSCGIPWRYEGVKPEAVDEEDELNGPTQSQPRGSKRKRLKANGKISTDTHGCDSTQVSQPGSELRRVTRASSRRR
ncbi:hypothetical protein K2173_008389 [Erythroxylum novogranatense]|uniref:Non-structural maintenance of chromosomes element 1 homolog n=1 Tax=Erythroxylum novogranatense TaxID=1862640 RepID=A0AAV8TKL4_9ROSI|nr:hypothetical protein K2173_008389 [Erythroxylum novogranatense]